MEDRKKRILQHVETLRKDSSSSTDIILLKTHRDLTKLLDIENDDANSATYSLRYQSGESNELMLKSI